MRWKRILESLIYKKYLDIIYKEEQNREFCKHDITHFLDVARVMYILCLENRFHVSKDVIYATALLHDIGRAV